MPNRLTSEKSPYLLQHKDNPVDWYPWGDEAFARARAEDRPIFLSIGYSTCHWCHVMERESFEKEEVAGVMNELYVNIKVDREERPDIDRVYMSFVQATTGSGGWPMSVWLTPQLEPFYGGTYFPPDDRYGRPGFVTVLRGLAEAWKNKREDVLRSAREIIEKLEEASAARGSQLLDPSVFHQGFRVFADSYDRQYGGFGRAPKFPRPVQNHFLLRYFARTGDELSAKMVVSTLTQMALGGLYDHLGGGFHRYSVDREWHVPHFEKMLYDQAQLVCSYLEAYQIAERPLFSRIARETCDYVLRDLTSPETGAFFSAEDADSPVAKGSHERKEGAFYVFPFGELVDALGAEKARVFAEHYGCREQGNAEDPHGELTEKNILHARASEENTAARLGLPVEKVATLLEDGRTRLLGRRNLRPRPHLDDKILCSWNGLMISALARASQVLAEPRYQLAAERAATFLSTRLYDAKTGILFRRYRDGEVAFEAYHEDYAMLVMGLIDLYEASFEPHWLLLAETLVEKELELFFDPVEGGFFSTSGRDPSVLLRLKDDYDGAEPSSNSVAALNLFRLAQLLDRPDLAKVADSTLRCFSGRLAAEPHAMPQMLCAYDFATEAPLQIVLAGERDHESTQKLLAEVQRHFLPRRVLLLANAAFRGALGDRLPWTRAMRPKDDEAIAYVCTNHACERPTSDPAVLASLLGARPPSSAF